MTLRRTSHWPPDACCTGEAESSASEPRGCLRAYEATQTASSHPVLLELPGGASRRTGSISTPRRLASLGRRASAGAGCLRGGGPCLTVWSVTPGQSLDQWVLRSLCRGHRSPPRRLIVATDGCHRVLPPSGAELPVGDATTDLVILHRSRRPSCRCRERSRTRPELSRIRAAGNRRAIGALLHLMMFGRPPPVAEQPAETRRPTSDRRQPDPRRGMPSLPWTRSEPHITDLAQATRAAGSTRTTALTPLRTNPGVAAASPLLERISASPRLRVPS